jgi:hypothetical protein
MQKEEAMETQDRLGLVPVTLWRAETLRALPQEDAPADDPAWALAGDPDEDLVCRVTATTDVAPAGSVVVHSNGWARLFVPVAHKIANLADAIVADAVHEAASEAKARSVPAPAIMRSWCAEGVLAAGLPLVCEHFGCSEEEWFTDHDRFSEPRGDRHAIRDELATAVVARWAAVLEAHVDA